MTRYLNTPTDIWLTGAGSGIGYELADQLIQSGHRLRLSARRCEPLARLATAAPDRVRVLPLDMTDRDATIAMTSDLLEPSPVQLAILNAGTCEYLDASRFSSQVIANNVNTNLLGTANCIEAVLPTLRQVRRTGLPAALVIVSSSASWFPFARAEGYGASKAALTYLAHSLRADLAAEGIEVTVVSPGFVKTPLTDRNDFPMPFLITAEQAAQKILAGLRVGRRDIHFPRRFTWLLKILSALPQPLIDRLAARLNRTASDHQELRP
ncbi:SDR family NAD(P)-dependent oxidoreductase [Marinobacter sp. SS21]|uniref:SDR family NAD(P)-dependent oxidoreductase n=1 Tax=Marinobacter sp. SS21 TaxID=2979460 RepID=UPI00232B083D|nr:SDR family NAD(P)-dependent oxidoreductase [Marinobacter sp. SS21]MDC0661814.1 SDR family NAD(P)-dependent oxidoreductase [Marinobacter sp. SS21]